MTNNCKIFEIVTGGFAAPPAIRNRILNLEKDPRYKQQPNSLLVQVLAQSLYLSGIGVFRLSLAVRYADTS